MLLRMDSLNPGSCQDVEAPVGPRGGERTCSSNGLTRERLLSRIQTSDLGSVLAFFVSVLYPRVRRALLKLLLLFKLACFEPHSITSLIGNPLWLIFRAD